MTRVFKMKHLIYIFLLLIINGMGCDADKSNASQCKVAQVCISDISQEDCGLGMHLIENYNIFDCCPGCRLITEDGNENNDTEIRPEEECRPPYNCLQDNTFAPVQCKGDLFTGRCFCSDPEGNRIFGQMWRNEANDMSCECSRKRSQLEKTQNKLSTLHCTSNGDYEPLQCDEGLCWCAQPKTGQPTVPPIPEADIHLLPCHSTALVGENYLRRCESVVHALATINSEQTEHGTSFMGNPTTFCDYDGSYGPYQIQNGIAYCTGRDGKILGSWQVVSSEMAGMNCNCARDTMMYLPDKGMSVAEVCLPNGNYRPNQNAGNIFYCIDSDGYQIHDEDYWPQQCFQNN